MLNIPAIAADPAQLPAALERNVLMTGQLRNRITPNGIIGARIAANDHYQAIDAAGNAVPVFNLFSDGGAPHDSLRAYICNYAARQTHSVYVGSLAQFMFTTTMNGCTLGVGPLLSDGTHRVAHSNVGGQSGAQRQSIGTLMGRPNLSGVRLMEPQLYRRGAANTNATTFGIRENGAWRFFFQLYEMLGNGVIRLHGVFPVP